MIGTDRDLGGGGLHFNPSAKESHALIPELKGNRTQEETEA